MRDAVHRMKVVAEVRPVSKPKSPVQQVVDKLMKKKGQTFLVCRVAYLKRHTAHSISRRIKEKGAKSTVRTVQASGGVQKHVEVYAMWPSEK